jgi:DNA-binding CsgD family transcriptional regulator
LESPETALSVLHSLCAIRLSAGDVDSAADLGEEALAISTDSGELWDRGYVLNLLAQARWRQGEGQRAEALAQKGVAHSHALDDRRGLAILLDTLAWMAAERASAERCASLLGCAQHCRESVAAPPQETSSALREQAEIVARERLGGAAFAAAFGRGMAMSIEGGVAFALNQKMPDRPAGLETAHLASRLTRREQQIAALVAQGLSNKQIAANLVVSQRTAESHILNILNKLGFNSRSQIASWATTNDLVKSTKG